MNSFDHDVAIIGSGPAGIAAATALSKAGIKDVVVYEREAEVGGIPRHTHHPSFGLLVFKRPMSGPSFVRAIRKRCRGVRFETKTTITAIRAGGELDIATPTGIRTLRARHIILATGARETPRHARLISGLRPTGITTTGALQQFIYGTKAKPFKRPVIVGTELVSFSALWTLRTAEIKAVAMIEQNSRITAYRPASLFARILGVPIYYGATISDISDIKKLKEITIETANTGRQKIACDGVIFSGMFTGENTIARTSHLALNPATQLPQVDQYWISSDPVVSVIGNATHPADMGDQCYQEGLKAGKNVAVRLAGGIEAVCPILKINHDNNIKMTTPNIVRLNGSDTPFDICLHVNKPFTGPVCVSSEGRILFQKNLRCMPARRVKLKNVRLGSCKTDVNQTLNISLGHPN
ncbi:MAG: FAD-dependent oxidoreductase [Paracoccaceae bacterium]